VLAPGAHLAVDQVGVPEEMAWTLFGPLVVRELGDEEGVQAREERAARALDAVMARSWVIVNRAPTLSPTAFLAFHPCRDPGAAIRLHPLACTLLDADFDGDQVALYLPITEGGQREAGERLSIAGHLGRDASLIADLLPPPEALWGLASLGLRPGGLRQVADLAGIEVAAPNGVLTEDTLSAAMRQLLARDGMDATLSALERLMRRGFAVARASGASMSPFLGQRLQRPPLPEGDDPELWQAYSFELEEKILSGTDYADPDLGPQLLAIKVRERGRRGLSLLLGPKVLTDVHGRPVIARHSNAEGLTPDEMYTWIVGARQGLARYWQRWEEVGQEITGRAARGFTVLARARQVAYPGIVFARAAAAKEVDPLTDVASRLFVGLPAAL
jgi:hypothetical protein